MSPDEGDHGDVLFVLGLAGKLAELKWYQNVRSLLTPYILHTARYAQLATIMSGSGQRTIHSSAPVHCEEYAFLIRELT